MFGGRGDHDVEEGRYSRRLLQAYARIFPPVKVSLQSSRGIWAPEEATRAVIAICSAPVIDHCLHRGSESSRRACIPHLVLDCGNEGLFYDLPEKVLAKILRGEKLSQLEKAKLGLLRDLRMRVLLTVAYACNRCFSQGYRKAVIVLFFQTPGGTGHANMLLLEKHRGAASVTCYEPNGVKAAEAYGTEKRFFSTFTDALQPLVQRETSFRIVGLALQTSLGHRLVQRLRRTLSVSDRGYPVCQAAVLWFFASYIEADTKLDLAAFEERILAGDRRELKAELLSWILDLQAWVRRHYAQRMRALLDKVFAGSNVSRILLRYGDLHIAWAAGTEC
jgi:hypothetical protein